MLVILGSAAMRISAEQHSLIPILHSRKFFVIGWFQSVADCFISRYCSFKQLDVCWYSNFALFKAIFSLI